MVAVFQRLVDYFNNSSGTLDARGPDIFLLGCEIFPTRAI